MTNVHPLLDGLLAHGRARRPLVAAHRGASVRAPENTLAAFRAALEDGAEMIELDVHLTADGRLAVIHDETTERTTGVPGVVAEMTMERLHALDAGHYMGDAWTGESVPELGEVFDLARGRLIVNVEIKGPAATAPVLARCVAEHGMMESVIVSSFDVEAVHAASLVQPPLLVGLLTDEALLDPVEAARAVGASLLHVDHVYVTAELVELLHEAGLGVVPWTVNDPAEMRHLQSLGVDAMMSDDPGLLCKTVG